MADKKTTELQEEKKTSSPSIDMKIGAGLLGGFVVAYVSWLITSKTDYLILALLLYCLGLPVYLFAIADVDNGETLGFSKRIKNGCDQIKDLFQLVKAPLVVGFTSLILMGLIYAAKLISN